MGAAVVGSLAAVAVALADAAAPFVGSLRRAALVAVAFKGCGTLERGRGAIGVCVCVGGAGLETVGGGARVDAGSAADGGLDFDSGSTSPIV